MLFGDMPRWNGAFIRVTGNILTHPEGGPFLSGVNCPAKIEVKGQVFPNMIQLGNPESKHGNVHHVDYTWDKASWSEFMGALVRLDPKTEHLRVTVVGLFETRTPLSDLILINAVHPEGLPLGFGDQGAAPAQILVKTITKLRFEKNQRQESGRGG